MSRVTIAVVPFSDVWSRDRLFDVGSDVDRDDALQIWAELRCWLRDRDVDLRTVDVASAPVAWLHLDPHREPPRSADPSRTMVMVWEPEVVAPHHYARARDGAADAASMWWLSRSMGALGPSHHFFRYPQVRPPDPGRAVRDIPAVMINGRKSARVQEGELYTLREAVARELAREGLLELYGRGWQTWSPLHPRRAVADRSLRRAARGPVDSKFRVLSRARFALTFENSEHRGYLTEKLFDALWAGALPVYRGDPEVAEVVPPACFIDHRTLGRGELVQLVRTMSEGERRGRVDAGRAFLASRDFRPFEVGTFCERVGGHLLALGGLA